MISVSALQFRPKWQEIDAACIYKLRINYVLHALKSV